jgi:TPR repeat protein
LVAGAEAGEARAQRLLAFRYLHGRGVPRDPALALGWMRQAAAQGFPLALLSLAEMLEAGLDGAPDREQIRALRAAAAALHPGAQGGGGGQSGRA